MKIANKILDNQDRDGMLRRSLERIIQLYTDKSHFVYELLQNAEDAGATSIKFIQYPDRLEVLHDGHPFTTENLQGLCDIGKSDKINDLNQIGEFGVGFKSVFGICEIVKLYSKPAKKDVADNCQPFSIEIQDFTKPVDIDHEAVPEGYTTRFIFPYVIGLTFSGFKTIKVLNETLSSRLKNLGVTTLLFMHHLALIEYEIKIPGAEASGTYMLDKTPLNDHCTLVSAIESENKKEEEILAFLKFTRPIDSTVSKRTVDIAFAVKVDKDGNYIFQKAKNPYISVYFPTETESKLDFIVQGPFRTTPNRSSVPANEEENEKLARRTSELLRSSIVELRDMGKLNLSFLKILPIDEDRFDTYGLFRPLYDEVWDLLGSEKVLPSNSGSYISSGEAILARSKELAELFTDELISELLDDGTKYKWLPTSITETSQYKEVFYYLRDVLEIDVIRPEDLRSNFNKNLKFLPKRDNEWLVRMYSLYETIPNVFQERSGNILDAVIVKTAKNTFVAPYRRSSNSYLPNVFLPSKKVDDNELDIVNPELYEKCKSFFSQVLHLEKPNEYEFFTKGIKRRYEKKEVVDTEQYIRDFKALLIYLNNPEYASDLSKVIRDFFVIKTRKEWVRPYSQKVLMPQTLSGISLEGYYKNIKTDILFIDFDWYQSKGIFYESLQRFGVTDNILTGESTTWGEYYSGNPGRQPEWRTSGEYRWKLSIDKIEDVLRYISAHPNANDSRVKSNTIFRLLQENQNRLVGTVWIGGSSVANKYEEPSEIIHILRQDTYNYHLYDWNGKWLYTESNELVAQKQISKRDLSTALYGKVSLDSDLYELLGFKKNQVDQLEAVVKEYDAIPEEKRKSYFAIELERQYGISIEELNQQYGNNSGNIGISSIDDDEEYEFPTGNIKNWDALKKHAAQILCYASPVKYDYVVRHIRVSRPQDDVRAYLMNMYRVNSTYKYACQLCHAPQSSVEMCQLEPKPEVELDPMNLCLCPSCAQKFREIRNDDYLIESLLDEIIELDEDEISDHDHVSIIAGGQDFWFTQTHIAEIRELMRLKQEAEEKKKGSGIMPPSPPADSDEDSEESSGNNNPKEQLKSDANVYYEYVGKRVYHKAKKGKATVTKCDGVYLTLKFDSDKSDTEGEKYSLAMCLNKGWLEVLDE